MVGGGQAAEEYKELLHELTGDNTVKIIKRITTKHNRARREIASSMDDMGDTHYPETRSGF